MSDLAPVDWTRRSRDLLPTQFYDLAGWRAYVGAVASVIGEYDTTLVQTVSLSRFDYATGDQLDQWGSLLAEGREGLIDNDYRRILNAKVAAVRSAGTVPSYIDFTERLGLTPTIVLNFPSLGVLDCIIFAYGRTGGPVFNAKASRLVETARAAGTSLQVVRYDDTASLIFGSATFGFGIGTFAEAYG